MWFIMVSVTWVIKIDPRPGQISFCPLTITAARTYPFYSTWCLKMPSPFYYLMFSIILLHWRILR